MADQIQQAMQAIAAAEAAAAAQAAPVAAAPPSDPCVAIQGNYIQTQMAFTAASNNYQQCNTSNPSQYPITQVLQPVAAIAEQRQDSANLMQYIFQSLVTQYKNAYTSAAAITYGVDPLNEYKSILQSQLNTTTELNGTLEQEIASSTNSVNQELANIPQLTSSGPFGFYNTYDAIGYMFFLFYILFFILLSIVLYVVLKDTYKLDILLTGIVVLVGAATAGGYFCWQWLSNLPSIARPVVVK
jgi:hypothetical protein